MILPSGASQSSKMCKPRASGDDPEGRAYAAANVA